MNTLKKSLLSIALTAALAAAGCGGGGGAAPMAAPTPAPIPTPTPTPTPAPTAESFTAWSKTGVFALPETGAPVVMDELMFNFDGDENLNAYTDLLPVE